MSNPEGGSELTPEYIRMVESLRVSGFTNEDIEAWRQEFERPADPQEREEDAKWRDPAYRERMLDDRSGYEIVFGDLEDDRARLENEEPIDIAEDVSRDVLVNAGLPALDQTDPVRRSLGQPSLWQELRTWELRQQAAAAVLTQDRSQLPGQAADRLAAEMTRVEVGRDDVNLTLPMERDPGRVLGR